MQTMTPVASVATPSQAPKKNPSAESADRPEEDLEVRPALPRERRDVLFEPRRPRFVLRDLLVTHPACPSSRPKCNRAALSRGRAVPRQRRCYPSMTPK